MSDGLYQGSCYATRHQRHRAVRPLREVSTQPTWGDRALVRLLCNQGTGPWLTSHTLKRSAPKSLARVSPTALMTTPTRPTPTPWRHGRALLLSALRFPVPCPLPTCSQKCLEMTDHEFVDFLFGKMFKHVDMEEIDLTDDDSIMVALDFEQLCLPL